MADARSNEPQGHRRAEGAPPAARRRVPRPPRPASVAVRAARARPPAVAPRAPRPATRCPSASRAGRCRCTCGCRSCAASRTRSASSTRSSTWTASRRAVPRGWRRHRRGPRRQGRRPRRRAGQGARHRRDHRHGGRHRAQVLGHGQGQDRRSRRLRHRSLTPEAAPRQRPGRRDSRPRGVIVPRIDLCQHQVASRGRQEDLVLTAFARAFRTPDLRKKLLFTLAIMAIFRLGSFVPTPGVSYSAVQACLPRRRTAVQRRARPGQPVQRRSAAPAVGLRARDHAVHHGEHHRAAAHGGHPAVRDPQEGGPGRHGQADPVHPLPDHRPGRPAVGDARHAGAQPGAACSAYSRQHEHRARPRACRRS